jgi:hypothetical protein
VAANSPARLPEQSGLRQLVLTFPFPWGGRWPRTGPLGLGQARGRGAARGLADILENKRGRREFLE